MTYQIQIRISHDYPPIPGASPGWGAWNDAMNPDDGPAMGTGPTPGDAITDLLDLMGVNLRALTWCGDTLAIIDVDAIDAP